MTVRRWAGLGLLALAFALALFLSLRPPVVRLAAPGEAQPALWQIEKDGRRAYLFGTMHILPPGARWMTPAMHQIVSNSDRLILEAANLDDRSATRALFERLGMRDGLPMLSQRIAPAHRPDLESALKKADLDEDFLSQYESWAAAIILSSYLLPPNEGGVEPTLIRLYKRAGKPIDGLETVEGQFGYFDRMPDAVQNRFLVSTATESRETHSLFDGLYRAWAKGNVAALDKAFAADLGDTPELRDPLLIQRNRAWAAEMDRMLAPPGRALIAVGAAHLVGADSLIDLLRARGYTVRRVQ